MYGFTLKVLANSTWVNPHFSLQTLPDKVFPIAKNSMGLAATLNVTMDLTQKRETQGIGNIFRTKGIKLNG